MFFLAPEVFTRTNMQCNPNLLHCNWSGKRQPWSKCGQHRIFTSTQHESIYRYGASSVSVVTSRAEDRNGVLWSPAGGELLRYRQPDSTLRPPLLLGSCGKDEIGDDRGLACHAAPALEEPQSAEEAAD